MSFLVATVIHAFCSDVVSSRLDVCSKSMEAGSIQSGVEPAAQKYEKGAAKAADRKLEIITNNHHKPIITLASTAYVVAKENKLVIEIPNAKICDSLKTEISFNNYGIYLKWGF